MKVANLETITRYAVVVQDLATQWIQAYPCKTKTSQETQRSLQKFLEPDRKPKVIYTDNSLEFGKSCEEISWNHCSVFGQDFPRIWQSFDIFFFKPNMHFQCCILLQGTLGGNFDIFAASGASTAWVLLWKTRSRPVGVRVCPVAQFNFCSTSFDLREWTTVVLQKEDSGRQPQLIIPENGGGDETYCPSLGLCGLPVPPGPPGPPGSPGLSPG